MIKAGYSLKEAIEHIERQIGEKPEKQSPAANTCPPAQPKPLTSAAQSLSKPE